MKEELMLQAVDFSRFSQVRDSLKGRLMHELRQRRMEQENRELDWDELDQLVAAKGIEHKAPEQQ